MATTQKTFYEDCTIEDLRAFVQNRTPRDSQEITKSWLMKASVDECIPRLEALDKKATFRFMDLPTELRLNVYRELLFCTTPQLDILRVSKQINEEAEDVLYQQSVTVGFCVVSARCYGLEEAATMHVGKTRHFHESSAAPTMDYYERIPGFVRKLRQVEIDITLYNSPLAEGTVDPYTRKLSFVNFIHILYALVTTLASGELKTLSVKLELMTKSSWNVPPHINTKGSILTAEMDTLLGPLKLLPLSVSLRLHGTDLGPNTTIEEARRSWQGAKLDLVEYLVLKDQVRSFQELVKRTGVAPAGIRCLNKMLHDLEVQAGAYSCTVPDYAYFTSKMSPLRCMLERPQVAKLIQKAKEIESQEKSTEGT